MTIARIEEREMMWKTKTKLPRNATMFWGMFGVVWSIKAQQENLITIICFITKSQRLAAFEHAKKRFNASISQLYLNS